MKINKLLLVGAVVFILSVIVGFIGTGYGVLSSFLALRTAESAGIERVGDGIGSAMVFTVVSILGSTIGLVMMAAGAIASYRRSKK